MKKQVFAAIFALAMAFALTACGGGGSGVQTLAPAEKSDTPSSEISESKPSTSQPTAPEPNKPTGTGKDYDHPIDISAMPEDLSGSTENLYYIIEGKLDGAPGTIVKTTQTDDYTCVISVPGIPDRLIEFAESRGDHYYMAYVESKTDGASGAVLVFYHDKAVFRYGSNSPVENFNPVDIPYGFASSNGALLLAGENLNAGFANQGLPPYMESGQTTLDPYDETSMTPSDEHIDLVLDAVANP